MNFYGACLSACFSDQFSYTSLRVKGRKFHLVRGQFTLYFSHFPNIAGCLNKLSNTLLDYFPKAIFEYCNIYGMM